MAILNSIRKRGIFLILIIALALFAFILSDVLTRGGGGSIENTVATVNGEDIERQAFMEKVEATQRTLGPTGTSTQAMNIVWERELRRVLMGQEFEKLGLSTGKDQINSALSQYLASNPTFQDEAGNYSEFKMREYVADITANRNNNPGAYDAWMNYIDNLEQTVTENNYLAMLKGGINTTLAEGEMQYHFENDKVNMEYVYIPYTSINDADIDVSEEEIAAYIKANPKKYEVDPQVDFQYVLIEEKASQQDIEDARTEMNTLLADKVEFNNVTNLNDTIAGFASTTKYAEFVNANSDTPFTDKWFFENEVPASIRDTVFGLDEGDIYGPYQVDNTLNLTKLIAKRQLPDSAKVRHILIPIGMNPTDSIVRDDAQAKKTADSVMALVKANRSRFPDLVTALSSDRGSIENGGQYDWFGYNRMVAEFRDFSFEKAVGEIGIAKTQFGYHIIEVEGQKNMQPVVKYATVSKEIEPSETTINETFSKATNLEIEATNGNFEAVSQEQGYSLRPVNKVGEMDANIPGIGNFRSLVSWAFNEETEIGDVRRFNVPQGYVIAQLTRRNPKGLMSVADASAIVTPTLRNDKKAEQIMAAASGTTLQEIAASQSVTVQTATAVTMSAPTIPGAGNEPEVVGAAFGTKPGEMTDFIRGKAGVFKVRVTAFNEAPALENYANYANQLNSGAVPALNSSIYNALKKSADIEDNRSTFY